MSSCSQQFQEGQLRFLYIKKRSIQLSVPLTYPSKSLRTSIPSTPPPPPKQFKRWVLKTPAKPSKSFTFHLYFQTLVIFGPYFLGLGSYTHRQICPISVDPRGLCPTWCHSSFSASFGRLVPPVMPRIERVLAIWCGNPGGKPTTKIIRILVGKGMWGRFL